MSEMLTRRQQDVYDFLLGRQVAQLPTPSYEEIRAAIGLKSKSGVNRLIKALEERGYIIRLPYRARAIEVVTNRIQKGSLESDLVDRTRKENERLRKITANLRIENERLRRHLPVYRPPLKPTYKVA